MNVEKGDPLPVTCAFEPAAGAVFCGRRVRRKSSTDVACDQPSGYVDNDDDCDDVLSSINPLATEVCDGTDNNCDGFIDETEAVDAATWYRDTDLDGWGVDGDTEVVNNQNVPSGTH